MPPGEKAGTYPTFAQLGTNTARLLTEASDALSADCWAIINRSQSTLHRLYDAAALRHTCVLLRRIAGAALDQDELTVRILGRAHMKAWLTGIYLHFGGHDALQRIAADTLHETTIMNNALTQYDEKLRKARNEARRRHGKIRADNARKALWNAQHPDEPPKPLLYEPHIPQRQEVGIDPRIADFAGIQARSLSLNQIADALTKLGSGHGFAREDFTQPYLHYRFLSAASVHPSLHLYDSYFEQPGHFVHTTDQPTGHSVMHHTWITALYSTALHVGWVLHDACATRPCGRRTARRPPTRPHQHQRMVTR